MNFVKAAIVLVGCTMYPSAFFADAAGAAGGDVIQEAGPKVTTTSVSIESHRVNRSQPSDIYLIIKLELCVSYLEFFNFLSSLL